MGLEAHQVTVPAPYLLITIVDKTQPPYPYSHAEASEPVSEQEFLADFKEAHEELEFGKAKKLLADFKIEYGSITKKNKSCTSTDMVDEGFIQGYTSNEASLWWHPMGRRVFFVRGEGAFELTDKLRRMPETRERDPKHSFIDFVEMFFVPFWEEPREGQITIIEVPRQKFTREQRIMLNKIKEQAQDVEFEEIQG